MKKSRIFHCERCLNGRTHIWLLGAKVLSWGPRASKPFKNPKLGVSYSVWDGEELLEQSIKQIRSVADYVNVVWQKLSWYGKPCSLDLEEKLLKLKADGLIDELIFFNPDLDASPSYNEINKRNVGLRAAHRAGCTHFMTMDTDEFYDTEQFRLAYADIIKRNLTHTACNIINYLTPTLRYRDYNRGYVLFISRIDRGEHFKLSCYSHHLPILCDPTRQIPIKRNSRFCFLSTLAMHHMKHVRKDINKKIDNSTLSCSKSAHQTMKDRYILSDKEINNRISQGFYIPVENKFNIEI